MDCQDIYKKIKAMRVLKGWSQEDVAEKLGIAVGSYAKIERGETDVHTSRLVQIAKTMEVDLSQLLELSGKNFVKILENGTNNNINNLGIGGGNNIVLTETECAHELEKAHLLLQERDKEVAYLKEIIALMKKD